MKELEPRTNSKYHPLSLTLIAISALALCFSSVSIASGGGGYSGGGFGSGASGSKPVDAAYEYGKSIVQRRHADYRKLKICVVDPKTQEKIKIKRKSLKSYKEGTVDGLATSLFNCDKPDSALASELPNDDLLGVLYYLNKRYRLKLK